MLDHWQKSRFTAPIVIILLILLANSLYIVGFSNPNPINTRSGLSNSITTNVLSGEDNIDPNDGFLTQSLGKLSADDILHGKLPWWDYNQQVGAPLAGGMQSASLFPPVLVMYFSNGSTYFHILLEAFAGIATYYLLLRFGLRKLTATVGGTVFALSSVFVWFWTPNTNPIAFLPLLILGVEVAYSKAKLGEKRGWFIIAIALALSIYAGFPEVTGLDGLLAGCWMIVRLFQIQKIYRVQFFKKLLTGSIAGLLIALPIIIAFLDYLPYANVGDHAGAIAGSVNAIGLPALFMPYIYGPIFGLSNFDTTGALSYFWSNVGGYVTGLMLFLAIVGLFGLKKRFELRPLKLLLAVWIIVMTLRIYGLLWFNVIMAHIPAIDHTAIYRYVQPSLVFAVVILMSFGLEHLLSSLHNFKNIKKAYWAAGFTIVLMLALLPLAFSEHSHLIGAHHQRLWLFASILWCLLTITLVLSLITLTYKKRIGTAMATYCIVLVILVDTIVPFMIPQLSAPRSATINTQPITYLQQHLGEYRFYSMGPVMPNYGSYFNISAINTNNVPVSELWTKYAQTKLDTNANPLVFTGLQGNSLNPLGQTPAQAFIQNLTSYEYIGVKYVATNNNDLSRSQAAQAGLTEVFNDSTATIYKLPNPNPYFQVVKGNCEISSSAKNELSANCATPSTILRRELYMPGWTATVNSTGQSVNPSGPLFQAINLPKGSSSTVFNFTPRHITAAFIVFCLTVVSIGLFYTPLFNKKLSVLISRVNHKQK